MPGAQRRTKTGFYDSNTVNDWSKLAENSPFTTMSILGSARRPSTAPAAFKSSISVIPNGVPVSLEANKASKLIDEELKVRENID